MKVRIGVGLGTRVSLPPADLAGLAEATEESGFDSLWFSERISGTAPDPVVAMAVTAARTRKLKFGMSVMVLPGRNPVLLAKQLATLDQVSGGRLLPAFGLGAVDAVEQSAFAVERRGRGALFDETLEVLRRCWSEDVVDHRGAAFTFESVRVVPKPVQSPPDVWLGGVSDAELRRVGRLGDGWLPSFVTPEEARRGWSRVAESAGEHGREIDPEHFGALIPYCVGEPPAAFVAAIAARRPDIADPGEILPTGWPRLADLIGRFVEAGASKFVLLPVGDPADLAAWREHLAEAADAVLGLQS